MPRARLHRRVVAAGALVTAGCLALATVPANAGPTGPHPYRLPGSLSPQVRGKQPIGPANAARPMTVQLWLKPDAGAESFARNVSTPGSSAYQHYLSPAEYTARYGPSGAVVRDVRHWLRAQGFTHITTDPQRNYVRADAPVRIAQNAFSVKINRYRVTGPDGRPQTVSSNDREVTLPAGLGPDIVGVTGLDNFQPQTFHTGTRTTTTAAAADSNCSTYYGQKVKSGLPKYHGGTKFPFAVCGYTAKQLRAAYGMNSRNNGAGQTVAYIEVGTPYKMVKSLTRFAKLGGLAAPGSNSYRQLSLGRGNACGNPFDIEEQLDVEAGYAMAPGAKHLLVGGDSCNVKDFGVQALFDADLAVINGTGKAPLATIASNSWGLTGGESIPGDFVKVLHNILTRAAAEGVGMYFSSGDDPGLSVPANDPYAIAVGGTSLGVGSTNNRLFETGWSNEMLEVTKTGYINDGIGRSAAGGGPSLIWKQPAYQRGVVPAAVAVPGTGNTTERRRTVPDISAVADPFTGIQQVDVEKTKKGDRYWVFADGGTSLAAPLVAGMIATVQQHGARLGFANPALYELSGTPALRDALPVTKSTSPRRAAVFCPASNELCGVKSLLTLDSQDREYTDQSTTKGYDTMTGIGTPKGQTFIKALRAISKAGSATALDSVPGQH